MSKLFANKEANTIQLSIIQLYLKEAFDLLNNKKLVDVRQDKNDDFYGDETLVKVFSYTEAIEVFYNGINNRNISTTAMNLASSRSHAILKIVLSDYSDLFLSQFTIVDLAGTENQKNHNGQTGKKFFF